MIESTNTKKVETPSLEMEKPKGKLFDYENYGLFHLLAYPFVFYFKQFFKYFIVALIPEFIFFGIFRLILIDISYNYAIGYFSAKIDFTSDAAAAFFMILLLLAVIIFLLRSGILSSITWRTMQKGKANPFWALEATFKQLWEFIVSAGIMIIFVAIPSIFLVLSFLFSGNSSLQGLSWSLMVISVGLPLIFGSRISMYSTGITKDYYPAGTAFQKSWEFTKGKLWLRTVILLSFFVTIGFIGPMILTTVLEGVFGFWASFGMIFVRALFFPLLDISLGLSYMNTESLALSRAVFKEDIQKQQLISEKFLQSKKDKY